MDSPSRSIDHIDASVSGKRVFRKERFLEMGTNSDRIVGSLLREGFISGRLPFQARYWMALAMILNSFVRL